MESNINEKEEQLIKLLEYVPEKWDIGTILKDPNTYKSQEGLKILNRFKKEQDLAKAIKNKIIGDKYDEYLYESAMKINIDELIKDKFDYEVIQDECRKYLSIYKKYHICIEVLKNKEKNAFEEAVLNEFDRLLLGASQLSEKPKLYIK
ncbi:MAG: hypothetical protein IJ134_05585 [Bacilli bacterium]|nr:hypothetical protein [Bacilli bacterium]